MGRRNAWFLRTAGLIWLGWGATPALPGQTASLSPPADEAWTLEKCLDRALTENREIRSAQYEVERAEGVIVEAKAVWYPQVEARGTLGMENEDLFDDRGQGEDRLREDWRGDLRVTYSILSGGENSNRIEAARLSKSREFLRYQLKVNDIALRTKEEFYKILLHNREQAIQKEIIRLLSEEVDRQKSLFDAGRTTRFNILRTEVRLTNEKPVLENATLNLQQAGLRLADILEVPWKKESPAPLLRVRGSLTAPPLQIDEDRAIAMALMRRPESQILKMSIDIEKARAEVARASIIPKLDAFVQGSTRRDPSAGGGVTDGTDELAFGLLGRWEIFDGFAGKGEAMQAESRAKQFEIESNDVARRIANEVQRALNSLNQASAVLRALGDNVDKAEESLRLAYSSVEGGFGTQFDIIQATVDLNEARTSEVRARFDYCLALARLESTLFLNTGWTTGEGPRNIQQGGISAPSQPSAP